MNNLKLVNQLFQKGLKIDSNLMIKGLLLGNPSFKGYYLNYLTNFKCLPTELVQLLEKSLAKSERDEVLDLASKYTDLMYNKWQGKKMSFCIAVKNRSVVNVEWNGVTRNKTFVSSYKTKPMQFELRLLKNFVSSISNSCPKGAILEIVIVDFNSTDDPPENWIYDIVGQSNDDIEIVIVKSDEMFSRGKGLNMAGEAATGDVLFFTDADMLISKEFVIQCFEIALDNNKPFFPICYSYYTPFHKEGWVRSEGWGNLVIPRSYLPKISWWEKNSWGSEDNHMKEQLEGQYERQQGVCLYHQWHPEGDFKTKYYSAEKNTFDVVLAVTTYNRLDYLKEFIDSWKSTRNPYYNWHLIVNDDGSQDGTIQYLKDLQLSETNVHIIFNNRKGVHEGTNAIFDRVHLIKPDYIFKCDDDVIFQKKGWDNLYIGGLNKFGFICNYQTQWRQSKVLRRQTGFVAYSNAYYSQGAFIAMTYKALSKLGWMDTKSFGYKGYGHIDLAVRACRAGFNDFESFYDVENSSEYINYQFEDYKPAISKEQMLSEFSLVADEEKKERMKKFILNERKNVIYVPRSSIYEYELCSNKPNVHMIIHNNHIGGAEYVHFNHAKILKQAGCRITIWSIGQGYTFDKFVKEGFDIIHCPELFNDSEDWEKLSSSILDGDYVYNCNAYGDDKFQHIAKSKHIYYCTILHSNVDWIIKHHQKYKYFTYKYIVINQQIADDLVLNGIAKDKIIFVPNCLNEDFDFNWDVNSARMSKDKLGVPDGALIIGYVGRIGRDKNSHLLIDLANAVCSLREDVYFVVVGGRSERKVDQEYFDEFLNKMNGLEYPSRFIYVGEKTDSELMKYYDLLDIAINISPSEGLPISLLEQLGRGIHCVYPGFPAIKSLMKNFNSHVIQIDQRKSADNLEYSNEELNRYVQYLKNCKKIDLEKCRMDEAKLAKDLLSYNVSKTHLMKLFG